jgi:hypothetical protein
MSLELVANNPSVSTRQRVLRIAMDAMILSRLRASEVAELYDKIEAARDALSRILDRADGKNA